MPKVYIQNKTYTVNYGSILSDLLLKENFYIERPCGGNGKCKKCKVLINGKEELSCQFIVQEDITVELIQNEKTLSKTEFKENEKSIAHTCFALDIGTTTLALALIDIDTAQPIRIITSDNPQRSFGADIMTRIDHCAKNTVSQLQNVLIKRINEMITELNTNTVKYMYVAGNVTMLHTFFGVDCSSIGVAPYTPAFIEGREESADKLGINGVENIISLPAISSFIGADIVAGLGLIDMPENGKYNLFVDLGTNAEIVLYSNKKALCTSAAAGPCFEGANISCGMSATEGAVYSYKNGTVSTIGNKKPRGICGTGLIDIIAQLLRNGNIDKTGYMEKKNYFIAQGVTLSQEDVQQFQLAKSAVYSAIIALIKRMGIKFEEIDKMYVSGGFSAKLSIENAVFTGLFPKELANKFVCLNNSSLEGTIKYATEQNDLSRYIEISEYIDLSQDVFFFELFVNNIVFK